MNIKALKALTAARAAYKAAWLKACQADGIDATATFIVLSKGNRHQPELNRAAKKLQNLLRKKLDATLNPNRLEP